ncbi:MAG: prepilin-type N-terminal cleavage/methylation domain-containing protein [Magnetococcus sp. YQC-5]
MKTKIISHPDSVNSGFSLLEMVISITIVGMVVGMFAPMLAATFQTFDTNYIIRETDSRTRPAIERILREVRGAVAGSVTIAGTTLTFTDQTAATVTYTLVNGQLLRNGVVLADGISSLIYTKTTNGTVVTLTTDVTSTLKGQGSRFVSEVVVRN